MTSLNEFNFGRRRKRLTIYSVTVYFEKKMSLLNILNECSQKEESEVDKNKDKWK